MSVEQIEAAIGRLSGQELIRLTEWLKSYLVDWPIPEGEWEETPEQIAELERRLAEFKANPAIAAPFEPDYFDGLKRQLACERASQTPAG